MHITGGETTFGFRVTGRVLKLFLDLIFNKISFNKKRAVIK